MSTLDRHGADMHAAVRSCAAAAAAVGSVVLIGIVADIRSFAAGLPLLPAAKPNAALAVVALAIALYLETTGVRRRAIAVALLSTGVLATALATSYESFFRSDLGIDQLVLHDRLAVQGTPGRMPIAALTTFILLATALLLGRARFFRIAHAFAVAACAASLFSFFLVVFTALGLNTPLSLIPAAPVVAAQMLIAAGIFTLTLPAPWAELLFDRTTRSATLVRRVLPLCLLGLVLLGALHLAAEDAGFFDYDEGLAMQTTLFVTLIGLVLFAAGAALRKSEIEQLRRESDLAERDARWRATFDHAAIGIVRSDPFTFRMLAVNERLCAMLQYSSAELLSASWTDLTIDSDVDRSRDAIVDVLAGRRSAINLVKRYKRRDGSTLHASVTAIPVRASDGSVLYFVTLVEDIGEREEAAASLRASEERLRALLDSIDDLVIVVHADGVIQYAGPSCVRILLFDSEEMTGVNLLDFVHPDDRQNVTAFLADRAGAESMATPGEFRCRAKDGSWRWLECSGRRLPAGGIVLNSRDVTARVIAIRELQHRTEELAQSNEDLERFNRAAVGRELRMVDLKRRVNELSEALGRQPEFDLAFADARTDAGNRR